MAALATVGPPNPRADPECCSILHGLVAAVETLCKITEYQHEARTLLMENAERVGNRGRIICITNAKRWAANHSDPFLERILITMFLFYKVWMASICMDM
jgi:hypothetical protein